jgi:hypothetical protein
VIEDMECSHCGEVVGDDAEETPVSVLGDRPVDHLYCSSECLGESMAEIVRTIDDIRGLGDFGE